MTKNGFWWGFKPHWKSFTHRGFILFIYRLVLFYTLKKKNKEKILNGPTIGAPQDVLQKPLPGLFLEIL